MGKVLLVGRLAVRDLRYRPAQAVLLVLAITAATATLALALALDGVTSRPYQQTRAATRGPDVVAQLGGPGVGPPGPGQTDQAKVMSQTQALLAAPGVIAHSGPYLVASAILRYRGHAVGLEAEGRGRAPAALEQPVVTAGTWVRPGGVVIERTFADALGVTVGDRLTLNGRPYTVAGIAVTAASPPYPNLCYSPGGNCVFDLPAQSNKIGLGWVTGPDAASLASAAHAPPFYFLNLRLADPARARTFAHAYEGAHAGPGAPYLIAWQDIATADGLLVTDEQQVLMPGVWLLGLLAAASVAVLAGGRMAEQTRRVGLLKAAGATPGLVATALLAQHLALAALAAGAGLGIGWLAAPLLTSPGAGLTGTPGAPSLTPAGAALVLAAALTVALAATLVPAVRASRTSTVSALAGSVRPPRRRPALIGASRLLPVPLLLGLRLLARRPRRALLSAASVTVAVTGVVAVLALHATFGERRFGAASGLADPVAARDEQMLALLTVVLLALAALNAVITAWASVLDARRASAVSRALGATPRQLRAAIAVAQVLAALPGALLGVPLGIALFAAANGAGLVTVPPSGWLLTTVAGTLLVVAALTDIPARLSSRRPVAGILQSETS